MSWDVAVAGGGVAGATAALRLAAAKRRVVLFERARGPHDKVCGEFLSGEAARELVELDLPPARLGAAPVEAVRLVAGRTAARAALPFAAWGLTRRRLDQRLLAAAAAHGVTVRPGVPVRGLEADGVGVSVATRDDPLRATAALLATGKHDLAGWQRPGPSAAIGLKLHLDLDESQRRLVAGHVELALFRGGYAGLQLVEEGVANLCLVVSRDRFAALGRDWRRLVAGVPHLATRLAGAGVHHARPLAVAGMPYGWLAGDGTAAPVYRLGDQAAVIPSFTGDGMAMALRSARFAADAIRDGLSPVAYHEDLARAFRGAVRKAGLVAALAGTPLAQQLLAGAGSAAPWLITRIAGIARIGAAA
jgi:flavin-dependent dehydrogenase